MKENEKTNMIAFILTIPKLLFTDFPSDVKFLPLVMVWPAGRRNHLYLMSSIKTVLTLNTGKFTKLYFVYAAFVSDFPCQYEQRHDRTNKVSVHQAKTQISLGIYPV